MNKKILNLLVALAMVSVCFFQSCKDQSEDILIAANAESSSAVEQTKKDLETKITALEAALEAKKCECDMTPYALKADVEAQIALLQTAIDGLKDQVTALETTLAATNATVADVVTRLGEAEAAIIAANARIDEVNNIAEAAAAQAGVNAEKIANLEPRVSVLETKVAEALAKAEAADAKAEANAEKIAALEELAAQLDQKIDDEAAALRQELAAEAAAIRKETIEAVAEAKAAVVAYVNGLVEALNDRITATENSIAALDGRVNALELEVEDLQEAVADLQDQIDTLVSQIENALDMIWNKIEELENVINEIGEKVEALEEEIAKIENALAKLITGIEIQQVYNPMFGAINTPFGFNTNVLVAYYGEGVEATFPHLEGAAQETYENGVWMSEEADNAGSLYLTINPAEVDFTGVNVDIVNSRGEKSAIKLQDIAASDDLLYFGATRGDVATGLYKANAHLEASDVDAVALNIDKDALVSAAKEVYENKLNANVTSVAKSFYNVVNNMLPAQGLAATYVDPLSEETKTVTSKYELAATAVKPLGYQSLDFLPAAQVPALDRARNFINKYADKLKNTAKYDFSSKVTIPDHCTKITFEELTDDQLAKFVVTHTVVIDTTITETPTIQPITPAVNDTLMVYECRNARGVLLGYVAIQTGDLISIDPITPTVDPMPIHINVSHPFTVDLRDAVKDFYGDVTGPMTEINDFIGQVNTMLDQINDLLDEIERIQDKIVNAVGTVQDRLISYLDKINTKLQAFDFNHMLQPCMILETSSNVNRLVGVEAMPQKVAAGEANLLLTSYTAEILAPAYKKYVQVKEVGGSKLTGENLNTILDGAVKSATVTLAAGKTYEITLCALDFHGNEQKVVAYVTAE